MKKITTTVTRVEGFKKSFDLPGDTIGVFLRGVTKEEIQDMLAKYNVVLIRSV